MFLVLSVGEMDRGRVKVQEWQETMYGLDSGIQSGATTYRDDDGEYTTSTRYVKTTTISREEPGEAKNLTYQFFVNESLFMIILITIFLLSRPGKPVDAEQNTAGSGCNVPGNTGGRHHHPVDPDRPSPDDQCAAAGRAITDVKTGHHPPDQLPR